MKRFRFPIATAIGLVVLLFVVRQCRQGTTATFQTTSIARGAITQAVTATGTLNPVVTVQVGSQVSGNIAKLFADFNSEVKAGAVVAQIDPVIFQATVTQAEGDLASAQAALELARANATRTEDLVKKQNSARADLDQAMASLHQAEASIKIKQGIESTVAKQITGFIRDGKFKVTTQIQGEEIRVTGKSRDDLQSVIAAVRGKDFPVALQFQNFRD